RDRAPGSGGSRAIRSSRTRAAAAAAGRRARRARASPRLRPRAPAAWLRHEEVRAAALGGAQEIHRGIAVGERALERVARGEAPGERETGVARLQLLEGAWHLEKQMRRSVRSAHGAGTIAVGAKEVRDALGL